MSKTTRQAAAIITYEMPDGTRREWRVACLLPADNESTMRKHFDSHIPLNRKWIGVLFEEEIEPTHQCGSCGETLTLVRPGKHQCDNPKCVQNS